MMNRKDFLKKSIGSLLGVATVSPIIGSLAKNSSALACALTSSETAGPFPTMTPASYVRSNIATDITATRYGVPLVVNILIQNSNNNCSALSGAMVDIWHCDNLGEYSEYGGTTMQAANWSSLHFLRGRQITNAAGMVTFNTIFPGWYQGRSCHIHVHIYSSTGTSLLVTQIAFPRAVTDYFYDPNKTNAAVSNGRGYAKGIAGYTYNTAADRAAAVAAGYTAGANGTDNVFTDSLSNELASVTGDLAIGYVLTHTIVVAGATGAACAATAGTTSF